VGLRIVFEALNEGYLIQLNSSFDGKGSLISANQWNIGAGYIATIIIESLNKYTICKTLNSRLIFIN
jgi:hypothetical protein